MGTDIVFAKEVLIRFGHCDPAGIVFYPRYYELLNALVEDWFNEGLGIPYAELLGPRRTGLPTVRLETDFKRIARMGDVLTQTVRIARIGRTSLALSIAFVGADGEPRVAFEQVIVCTSLDTHLPTPFPSDLRAALERAPSSQEQ